MIACDVGRFENDHDCILILVSTFEKQRSTSNGCDCLTTRRFPFRDSEDFGKLNDWLSDDDTNQWLLRSTVEPASRSSLLRMCRSAACFVVKVKEEVGRHSVSVYLMTKVDYTAIPGPDVV